MPAWSSDIANTIILTGRKQSMRFNQMQLQKLVYLCHGWSLALQDKPMTHDMPVAMKYSINYLEIARAFHLCGVGKIRNQSQHVVVENQTSMMTDVDIQIIEQVVKSYGNFRESQLSALTHSISTPWHITYNNGQGLMNSIQNNLIQEYFLKQAEKSEQKKAA